MSWWDQELYFLLELSSCTVSTQMDFGSYIKKRLTVTQSLMYSSNLNINIHWAFVTFKILLDALQSIPFQISTSNYAFKLITTDQRLLIVFGEYSPPPSTAYTFGNGWQRSQTTFCSEFWRLVTKFWLTLSRSLPVEPHLALDDWPSSRKQRCWCFAAAKQYWSQEKWDRTWPIRVREGLFLPFEVLLWGFWLKKKARWAQ